MYRGLHAEAPSLLPLLGIAYQRTQFRSFQPFYFWDIEQPHGGTCGNQPFTTRGAAGEAIQSTGPSGPGRGPCGEAPWASFFPLVEPITEGPMSLNMVRALSRAFQTQPSLLGVCPLLQRFPFRTALPETPGVRGPPSYWAAGLRGRGLQMVIVMP